MEKGKEIERKSKKKEEEGEKKRRRASNCVHLPIAFRIHILDYEQNRKMQFANPTTNPKKGFQ